nr:hypothetical protein [Tanacetum cinerariifolium]
MIIKKDSKIVKAKVKRKSLALKANKESSDEECLTFGSEDEDGEEDDEKVKDEMCLVAHASNEICLRVNLEPDEWIKDSRCSKHMMGNRKLFSTYKAYNGGNVIFGSNLRGNIIGKGYSQNSKACIILNKHTKKIKESLNVTFNEIPPPSKTSPLVDDDLDEDESIREIEKKNLENIVEDETLEIDEIVNIKESMNHPLENVIRNLNQRTLRNKLDENGVVSQDKARLVAQGYNQQKGIDYDETYAPVARLESIRILLAYACALDFKLFQMDVKSAFLNGFISEKKALYGLKQAPKAWPDIMFSVCLCACFQEAPKTSHLKAIKHIFRYIKVIMHLGLWYPKGTNIETVVYADSDHAGDYVDRKSTSGICTFVGCFLISWFSKKQTALAISTTEAVYVSAEKECQQVLWMKQALIDYNVRLDDVPSCATTKARLTLSKSGETFLYQTHRNTSPFCS